MSDPLRDSFAPRPVLRTDVVFEGAVWSARRDTVDLGAGGVVERDYVVHPGAVAALALDEQDRVVVLEQYRHPVRSMCWELPAGLRDVEGEPLVETARRELAEEAGLAAGEWFDLLTLTTTSGGSDEVLTVFLARGLTDLPADQRHVPTGEEIAMEVRRVPLDELARAVLGGGLRNSALVAGVLAALALRSDGWQALRPVG